MFLCTRETVLNPFRPNSDQHQISPDNISMLFQPLVMRMKDMITHGEFSWYLNIFSTVLL